MRPTEEQTILVTGATDGLGRQVALDLAGRGATVLVHGRNPEKIEDTVDEIRRGSGKAESYVADLSSLAEVRRLAEDVRADHDRLDVLVNNAGIGSGSDGTRRELSADGLELRFAVNYLAGFLLTIELLALLRASAPARVVNVSSAGQMPIDFADPMLEHGYSGVRAYCQSKLAQIMFTAELAERVPPDELAVTALHPATYMDTNMVRESGAPITSTVRQGADATERLIADPSLDGVSGRYFNGMRETRPDPQAADPAARTQLWDLSERLVAGAA
ncbi:MAG TPA: SDR family NAD(P)-dependent oxidoreductase [Thermoleophilaceae bacterium]